MDKIYVVCENKTSEYIPEPHGPSITNWNQMPFEPPINMQFPMKPRFDPIIPQIYPGPKIFTQIHPNNIVCLCKDLDTAKHYLNGFSNRYILGPYKIM
jgi:hypothetical protein